MPYLIPDVPLIPQDNNMACWYASAQMLIAWRRNRTGTKEARHPDPSEIPAFAARVAAKGGLRFAQNVVLAKMLGLAAMPLVSPTPATVANWLFANGPLWLDCLVPSGHVVVVTGITDTEVLVNDPWPPHVGARTSWSLQTFNDVLLPLIAGPPPSLAPNMLYLDEPTPDMTVWSLLAAFRG